MPLGPEGMQHYQCLTCFVIAVVSGQVPVLNTAVYELISVGAFHSYEFYYMRSLHLCTPKFFDAKILFQLYVKVVHVTADDEPSSDMQVSILNQFQLLKNLKLLLYLHKKIFFQLNFPNIFKNAIESYPNP